MMFSGSYKFMTEAIKSSLEFAFLYSRLQETDREFTFTGKTTSWKRFSFSAQTGINICIELPEPTGVYATEQDAINDKQKPEVAPRPGNTDPTSETPTENVVTLFYEISAVPSNNFVNIFKVLGTSTHPGGNPDISLDPIYYGFWRESGVLVGIAPWERPEYCPLFKNIPIPAGLGRVGYIGEIPTWKKANYIPSSLSNGLNYQNDRGVDNEDTPYNNETISFWEGDRDFAVSYFSQKNIIVYENLITPGLSCSQTLNNNAWLGAELPHRYQTGGQVNDTILICVVCDSRNIGAIEGFLRQVMTYWNIPGSLRFLSGANAFGCGSIETGFSPDPNPSSSRKVYSSRFKGRYSELILNYQSRGRVKELKLPIEFPTRATKIKLIPNAPVEHYKENLPIDSEGWQPVEQPIISEAFVGRVNIDKDNIYVSVLYGTIREWEPNKPLPFEFNQGNLWIPNRNTNPNIGDDFLNYGNYFGSGTGGLDTARPKKDSWKYCRTFVINKQSLSITSDTTRENPQSLDDTKQLFISYTITHQEKSPRYPDYKTVGTTSTGNDLVQISELLDPSDYGFSGNPVVYPQITGTIRGAWITSSGGDRFFPIGSVPDFIKSQTLWTQKEWLFWNLLERPRKPLSNATNSYFQFELQNKFGGHGRSSVAPRRFYIDLAGIDFYSTTNIYRTHESYFGEVVESERLRGSAILDQDNKIVKWVRISPYSYPYFEPGILKADNQDVPWG